MTPWRALFGVAVVIALIVGYALRDTPGYVVRNPDGSVSGDMTHYVYWTRLVTENGMESAYAGTWPETYAVYPPLTLYPLQFVGSLYQKLQDPAFDPDLAQESLWLREAFKFVALAWHLFTALAIFLLVQRFANEGSASLAATLYVINPAALYDVAHWAQPDGAHSVFSVLAVGVLQLGQVIAPWMAFAAAALAKPQAWSLFPLFAVATVRTYGLLGLAKGVIAAAILGGVIVAPFVATGRLDELASLPSTMSSVMPVVSADAHNLWWLVLQSRGQDPLITYDGTRLISAVSFRTLAAFLVAATLLFTAWLYWTRRAGLAEAAALGVLGWFTVTTQAHENHLFFALPLLALAWPSRRWLLIPFGVLSLTLGLNMLLHDQFVLEALGRGLQDPLVARLRIANAGLNVGCFLGWSMLTAVRAPNSAAMSATVSYRPRHTTQVGLEATGD